MHQEFAQQRWMVLGAGISGVGAARLLKRNGADVFLSDLKAPSSEITTKLALEDIPLHVGPQEFELLNGLTGIIPSPGIPLSIPLLKKAVQRGIRLVSEIDLACRFIDRPIIGVTGTNGKSTTSAMFHHILGKRGYRSFLGGNFGFSPCDALVDAPDSYDYFVLELSSYQLELSRAVSCDVVVFTSFSSDHMARHGTSQAYFEAKWNLVRQATPRATIIAPADVWQSAQGFHCPLPKPPQQMFVVETPIHKPCAISGSQRFSITPEGLFQGEHKLSALDKPALASRVNRLNAVYACLGVEALVHQDPAIILDELRDFRTLPFRTELIGTWKGFPIINDSKSTNVDSTLVALGEQTGPVILLLGGRGKGDPYAPILRFRDKISCLVIFGEDAPALEKDLGPSGLSIRRYDTLKAAVGSLPEILAQKPGAVLFSPACASFDEFKNYEHRGQFFTEMIRQTFRDRREYESTKALN